MVEKLTSNISTRKTKLSSLRLQIVVAFIIFISGTLVGFGVTTVILQNKWDRTHRRPRFNAHEIAKDIGSKYELNDEQMQQVEEIFSKRVEAKRTLMTELREKMETEAQQVIADMNDILTPAQFEKWKKDFENKIKRGPEHFGPRHRKHKPKHTQ